MAVTIQFKLNEHLYLRDPQDTKLGRKIIEHSILLINEIGFEDFTFKKLAERIDSTEASVYRYFENKHLLLVYLLCWYWEWVKFRIELNTANVDDPRQRLRIAIESILESSRNDPSVDFVNESALYSIVIKEGTKAYHIKQVDIENQKGFFLTYKALCRTIANIILEIDPNFPYPRALASTLLEMANHHIYFSEHLPSLTDVKANTDNPEEVKNLMEYFAFGLLR